MHIPPTMSETEYRFRRKLSNDLGDVFMNALEDQTTMDLFLNPDGTLWQECFGQPVKKIGSIPAGRAESAIRTVAGCLDALVTPLSPILEGELPLDGSRFAGWIPPIVSAPSFAIRKKAQKIFTLNDYVAYGILSNEQHSILCNGVSTRENILVIGSTGSGKTTLTNALIQEIVKQSPLERILIIEDTFEIQCEAENTLLFHTTRNVSMTDLLRTSLRAKPDRILIGEVRGPEALDLLDTWNTGHEGGVATLHANNAVSALDRLQSLIGRHPQAPRKSNDIKSLIGMVVDIIVHIARDEQQGRKVKSVMKLNGFNGKSYQMESI